jgi:hypothetical protein
VLARWHVETLARWYDVKLAGRGILADGGVSCRLCEAKDSTAIAAGGLRGSRDMTTERPADRFVNRNRCGREDEGEGTGKRGSMVLRGKKERGSYSGVWIRIRSGFPTKGARRGSQSPTKVLWYRFI